MIPLRFTPSGTAIEMKVRDCEDDPMVLLVELSDDGKHLIFSEAEDGTFRCRVSIKRIYHMLALVPMLRAFIANPVLYRTYMKGGAIGSQET